MHSQITQGTAVAGNVSKQTAAQKRSAAKSENAEKLSKLPLASQYAVKQLRATKRTIEATIDSLLAGGPIQAELVRACAQIQMSAAETICG